MKRECQRSIFQEISRGTLRGSLSKQRMEQNHLRATAYFLLFRDGWRFLRGVGTSRFVGTLFCIGFFRPVEGIRLLIRLVG
jgi:hypothetical protein